MTEAAKRHAELQSRKAKFANLVASVGANPEPPLPLASVVAVTALMDIPAKGCTKAVATVEAGGFKRHVAVERESFHEGDVCVLFATNACVRLTPVYEKWRGELSTNLDFHYKKYGVDPGSKTLLFSNSLDFDHAQALHDYFKDRTKVSFGIGTYCSNDTEEEALNIVIKLQYVNGRPVAKISDDAGKAMCQDPEYLEYLKNAVAFRIEREKIKG